MSNNIQIFKEKTFGQMRGYVDKSGKVWLNYGDVVRGLGFVHPSGGIRQNKLRELLKRFGYSPKVTANDYIPENIFYRLAMRADSPNAEGFQGWLADDVIPSIRQTGSYSVKNAAPALPSVRQENISTRKSFTSVVQLFIFYAQSQGDTREDKKIYSKFSILANQCAGIVNSGRPSATPKQLLICQQAENLMGNILLKGMQAEKRFASIESNVILEINQFKKYIEPTLPLLY